MFTAFGDGDGGAAAIAGHVYSLFVVFTMIRRQSTGISAMLHKIWLITLLAAAGLFTFGHGGLQKIIDRNRRDKIQMDNSVVPSRTMPNRA